MRKRLFPILLLLVGLAYVQPVQADPEPAAPAATEEKAKPAGSLDTNADGKVDKDETAAAVAAEGSVGDVAKDAAEVVDAVKGLKDSGADKALVIMLLLGAIFKLLLSLIKVLGRNIAWFKTKDGKRVVKYSTLGLGALAALMSNLAFGMSWLEAAMIFVSGPVAVAIHEYTKDSKDTADAGEGTKPATG